MEGGLNGIGVVVLAAGASRRFGPEPKQLALVNGVPLLRSLVEEVLKARSTQTLVVLGCDYSRISQVVPPPAHPVFCPSWEMGLSESVKTGAEHAASADWDAAIFLPGDYLNFDHRALLALAESFHPAQLDAIHAATFSGQRKPPVLVPRGLLGHTQALRGDAGWKLLFGSLPVMDVPCDAWGEPVDVDTPEDLPRR